MKVVSRWIWLTILTAINVAANILMLLPAWLVGETETLLRYKMCWYQLSEAREQSIIITHVLITSLALLATTGQCLVLLS